MTASDETLTALPQDSTTKHAQSSTTANVKSILMHDQPLLAKHDRLRSASIDTNDSDQTDQSFRQLSHQATLSSQDFIELTRISRKKDDIEHHITNLQSWPTWDPFKDVSSYSADTKSLQRSRQVLDAIAGSLRVRQDRCTHLEHDIQQFNLEDMKRLRTVAKAISKRHLSGSDTDLLELALETVYALDKLLRLLRDRRTEHDLTMLRLQWENMVCSSWQDVVILRRDIEAFEHKCKALMAPRPNSNGASASVATSIDTHQATNKKRPLSSTHSSSKLATESMKLEASRLVLRIRSFETEKVRPAGRFLDLLIDQRQVPEKLIDEQEKLEEALPQPTAIEARSSEVSLRLGLRAISNPEAQEIPPPSTAMHCGQGTSPTSPNGVAGSNLASTSSDSAKARVTPQTPSRNTNVGSRARKTSASSMSNVPLRHTSNRYRSNPRDALDVAVGNIVNRMPMSVSIKAANLADIPSSHNSSTIKDLSGQYWIGDPEPRLCFCRILPSSTVMVRVGGGWQELSEFLTQHYAHLSIRGFQNDPLLASTCMARPGSSLAWLRSASGPAGSTRLRARSSAGSLRSPETVRMGTPHHPSRIVTMPAMTRDSALPSTHKLAPRIIPIATPEQVTVEHDHPRYSTPCKASELSSSGSASSIIIHSPSPSL
ncbi:uncharacterized protein UTRI_00300_B [Ustilago trichophora]|uniref:GAR domain-containing protein n=1 Tax=Ustilago trichophora TaxID=86804 RepID=A0A5C3DRR7_9BASI|nr:uncharacterized protein UTRI_00300_B [Ustilago trichophora]